MNVTVATRNPVKVEAVRAAFERFYPEADLRVEGIPIEHDTPEQPTGAEIEAGTIVRAEAAAAHGNTDLGIGLEAGLLRPPNSERWLSVQLCAIADTAGRVAVGLGPGYELPDKIREAVLAGEPLRAAFTRILGVEDVDQLGAVYPISGGRVDRRMLAEQATLMALTSRMASGDPACRGAARS